MYGMLYRLKRGFFPTKVWAMFSALAFFGLGIWALTFSDTIMKLWTPALFLFALWYGGVWFYRHSRDAKITGHVRSARQRAQGKVSVTKTNPESYKLSVPPQRPKPEDM